MTTRAQVKALIRVYLASSADDPMFGDDIGAGQSTVLDPIVQQVVDGLVGEIQETNPGYLSRFATLAADTPVTGRLYSLATQSSPITDFSRWLEVRFDNEDGALLYEARLEELRSSGSGYFAFTGTDEAVVLQTSKDTTAANPIWLRYGYWPAKLTGDSDPVLGVPDRYMDVVSLEALFAFGVGGESRWPEELRERWRNRRAALFGHVARRGVQNPRTRLYQGAGDYL